MVAAYKKKVLFLHTLRDGNQGTVPNQAHELFTIMSSDEAVLNQYLVRGSTYQTGLLRRIGHNLSAILLYRPHIVILDMYSGTSLYYSRLILPLCKIVGAKIIIVLRGGMLPSTTGLKRKAFLSIAKRAEAIICPSRFLHSWSASLGFDPLIIRNVIKLSNYTFRERLEEPQVLFWMRKYASVWNPSMAVKVLAQLPRHYQLVMAGPDEGLLAETKDLANKLGVEERIKFLGFVGKDEKKRLIEEADIYLHTNLEDNTPVSVIEMLASGVPVIASRVGGLPYLVEHEKEVLFVEADDVEGMAGAVQRLADDQVLRKQLANTGLKLAEEFSWDRVKVEWMSLFNQLSS